MPAWLRPLFVAAFVLVLTLVAQASDVSSDDQVSEATAASGENEARDVASTSGSSKVDPDEVTAARTYFEMTMPTLHNTDQLSMLFIKESMSDEDWKKIQEEMIKPVAHEKLPNISFKRDEFYVDGEATGLKISSYEPLRFSFQGRHFEFNKTASAYQNYENIVQFLSGQQHASVLFFSEAHADWKSLFFGNGKRTTGTTLAIGGGALGFWLGGPFGAALGAGGGGLLGYFGYGKVKQWVQQDTVDKLLRSEDLQIHCDSDSALLSVFNKDLKYSLRIYRNSGKQKVSRHVGDSIQDPDDKTDPGKVSSFRKVIQLTPAENMAVGILNHCSNWVAQDETCINNEGSMCGGANQQSKADFYKCRIKTDQELYLNGKCDFATNVRNAYLKNKSDASKPNKMAPATAQ